MLPRHRCAILSANTHRPFSACASGSEARYAFCADPCDGACGQQVETAEIQLDVMEEGIEELTNLERFVLKTKPPTAQAAALSVRYHHRKIISEDLQLTPGSQLSHIHCQCLDYSGCCFDRASICHHMMHLCVLLGKGEIVHQLMACLSHVGVPTKTAHLRAAATSPAQQETTAALVAHFRAHCHLPHPLPLPADLVVEEPQTPQAALPEEV